MLSADEIEEEYATDHPLEADAEAYEVVRFSYKDGQEEIIGNLSLEAARATCRDPRTSSKTNESAEAIALTERIGPWFYGYRPE